MQNVLSFLGRTRASCECGGAPARSAAAASTRRQRLGPRACWSPRAKARLHQAAAGWSGWLGCEGPAGRFPHPAAWHQGQRAPAAAVGNRIGQTVRLPDIETRGMAWAGFRRWRNGCPAGPVGRAGRQRPPHLGVFVQACSGLIWATRSSGTWPPFSQPVPRHRTARKCEQQAPQSRQSWRLG